MLASFLLMSLVALCHGLRPVAQWRVAPKAGGYVSVGAGRSTQRAAGRAHTALSALPTVFQVASAAPVMYACMSFSEYVTHRVYQHAEFNKAPFVQWVASLLLRNNGAGFKIRGGGHVEHHAETLDDMSLKKDERWLKSPAAQLLSSDPYRGTAFTWTVTFLMFLQLVVTCVPVMGIFGWSPLATVGWILPSLAAHTCIWNTIHPPMHGLPSVPATQGPPGEVFARYRNGAIFKWLEHNHVGHHVVGGQGNYNVCCPGGDFVFGTYVPKKQWMSKLSPEVASLYL